MDLFEILEIPKEASEIEIKRSYHRLAKKWHPDKNKTKGAKEKFQQINSAYHILSNRESREKYLKLNHSDKNEFIDFLNKIFSDKLDYQTLINIGLSMNAKEWKNISEKLNNVLNKFNYHEILQFYMNPNIPTYDIPEEVNCSESDTKYFDEEFSKNYYELPVEYQKFKSVDIRIALDIKLSDIFNNKSHEIVLERKINKKSVKDTFVFSTSSPYIVFPGGGDQKKGKIGHLIIKLNLPNQYIWKEETIVYQYNISLYQMIYGLNLEFQVGEKNFTYNNWVPHRDGWRVEINDSLPKQNVIDTFEVHLMLEYNHTDEKKQLLHDIFN